MKLLFILLFIASITTAQKVHYYQYGQDGMEIICKIKDSTIIYSEHQAKILIKREVGDSIVRSYLRYRFSSGRKTIKIKDGKVIGFLKISRNKDLVLIYFDYETILWNSGIIENAIKKK